MLVSIGCGLHCAALGLSFLVWPALWLNRSLWESGLWHRMFWLERALLLTAWLLAIVAMRSGWRRHRRAGPAALAWVGALGMSLAILTPLHFSGYLGTGIALTGGLMLGVAHGWNLRLVRQKRSPLS